MAADEEVDLTKDIFGDVPPDPAEKEETPVEEPAEEAPAEEPEPEPEPEAEVEVEAEPEVEAKQEPEEEAQSKPELPASALKELRKLRAERAQRNRESQQRVVVQPQPQEQATQLTENQVPLDKLPVSFDDEGKPYLDMSQLQGVVGRMMEPSPEQRADFELQRAESDFVAEDPTYHGPAAARMRQASEYLDLMSVQMVEDNNVQPQGVDNWVQALNDNGIIEQFQQQFPEVTDVRKFVNAAYGGNLTTLRYYMDEYVTSLYGNRDDAGVDGPAKVKAPKVVPLPVGRPRSMAKKGSSSEQQEDTTESRHGRLVDEAMNDPLGFSEDKQVEMDRLAKKLGII